MIAVNWVSNSRRDTFSHSEQQHDCETHSQTEQRGKVRDMEKSLFDFAEEQGELGGAAHGRPAIAVAATESEVRCVARLDSAEGQ